MWGAFKGCCVAAPRLQECDSRRKLYHVLLRRTLLRCRPPRKHACVRRLLLRDRGAWAPVTRPPPRRQLVRLRGLGLRARLRALFVFAHLGGHPALRTHTSRAPVPMLSAKRPQRWRSATSPFASTSLEGFPSWTFRGHATTFGSIPRGRSFAFTAAKLGGSASSMKDGFSATNATTRWLALLQGSKLTP